LIIRHRHKSPLAALKAVLIAYALNSAYDYDHHGSLSQVLHTQPQVYEAHHHLQGLIADLIGQAQEAGELDTTIDVEELHSVCTSGHTSGDSRTESNGDNSPRFDGTQGHRG
jgi:hypothetical protein